ncbi:MAG: ABC-type transport auxiliary lipoprotein family protein [Planctomycetota bacterium]
MPRTLIPLCLLALTGCFGGASPAPRSFRPELAAVEPAAAEGPALRYRAVSASPHLDQRMAWRLSPVEYWFADLWVWSEPPQSYADRALAQRLFEGRGLRRGSGAGLPALEAELREFCYDREAAQARVALHVLFTQPEGTQLERTLEATAPVGEPEPEAIARALGVALSAVCDEAAGLVGEALGK